MTVLDDCITSAMQTALSHPLCPGPYDTDERRSVAMCAAWEASTKATDGDGHSAPALARVITKRRLIDAHRRERGGVSSPKGGTKVPRPQTLPLNVDILPGVTDEETVEVIDLIDYLSRGDKRTALILARAAEGRLLQDIAAEVGVTPSRVSQILGNVRDGLPMRRHLQAA